MEITLDKIVGNAFCLAQIKREMHVNEVVSKYIYL